MILSTAGAAITICFATVIQGTPFDPERDDVSSAEQSIERFPPRNKSCSPGQFDLDTLNLSGLWDDSPSGPRSEEPRQRVCFSCNFAKLPAGIECTYQETLRNEWAVWRCEGDPSEDASEVNPRAIQVDYRKVKCVDVESAKSPSEPICVENGSCILLFPLRPTMEKMHPITILIFVVLCVISIISLVGICMVARYLVSAYRDLRTHYQTREPSQISIPHNCAINPPAENEMPPPYETCIVKIPTPIIEV